MPLKFTLEEAQNPPSETEHRQGILLFDTDNVRVVIEPDDPSQIPGLLALEGGKLVNLEPEPSLLDQFKSAYYTLLVLQALHYSETEEIGPDGKLIKYPPLNKRIEAGEAYVKQRIRLSVDASLTPAQRARARAEKDAGKALLAELKAREAELQRRQDEEYERMLRLEREIAGEGRMVCTQCWAICPINEGCRCWHA